MFEQQCLLFKLGTLVLHTTEMDDTKVIAVLQTYAPVSYYHCLKAKTPFHIQRQQKRKYWTQNTPSWHVWVSLVRSISFSEIGFKLHVLNPLKQINLLQRGFTHKVQDVLEVCDITEVVTVAVSRNCRAKGLYRNCEHFSHSLKWATSVWDVTKLVEDNTLRRNWLLLQSSCTSRFL